MGEAHGRRIDGFRSCTLGVGGNRVRYYDKTHPVFIGFVVDFSQFSTFFFITFALFTKCYI